MRPLTNQRPACILLAMLFLLLLTACGAGGESASSDESLQDLIAQQGLDPNKETLIYAKTSGPYDTDTINRVAIDKFNRTHDDVQIVVKDYSDPEFGTGGMGDELLRTELAAGQLPDILELRTLPYRQLAQKGYLEDLWPYIENDPDLGRASVIEAPLKAAEVDGKLCMLFGAVEIETLVGAADRVGDRTGWTLAELQEAFAAMPEDSTILPFNTSRERLFTSLARFSLANYVDWETGTCSFDSPSFRSLLEFASLFPSDEEIAEKTAEEYGSSLEVYEESSERLRKGLQMLDVSSVTVGNLSILEALHGGRCAFIGYPTGDGSVGSMFTPRGAQLGISSTCQNKEAAWEFIRTVLTDLADSYSYIPIKQDLYNSRKTTAMYAETLADVTSDGEEIKATPVTEEQIQRFEAFFNSIDKIDIWDRSLFFLVKEATGPYFAGDKTLDETVDLVQRRANLYVNENR